MNILLLSTVRKVGQRGQVAVVSDGYALNFLIPRHLAIQATPGTLKAHEHDIAHAKEVAVLNAEAARKLARELIEKKLTIAVTAAETGTLFKALHEADLVAEIKSQWHIDVPEEAVHLAEPIKSRGTYHVPIELGEERVELEVVVA